MKKIKAIVTKIRNNIRGMKFIPRTIITVVASFAAVLAFSIGVETVYNTLATHSGLVLAAGLIAGQYCLYAKDLARLSKLAADPAKGTKGQSKSTQKERVPKKEKAQSFMDMVSGMGQAFAEEDPDDEFYDAPGPLGDDYF